MQFNQVSSVEPSQGAAENLVKLNVARCGASEIEELFVKFGEPKFRAGQLLRWIWKEGVTDFEKMSNVSKSLRERLKAECEVKLPKIVLEQKSEDGTIKYLMQMDDGKTVETVWIPRFDQDRVTVCVSSQMGCKMGCTFCLTAQQKVERNLTAGEIAGQLLALPNRHLITNVVLMGMGEPFDNYDNLMSALKLISDPELLGIGPRKITVSTSGLVPRIRQFIMESKVCLAISLNAPNDEIRNEIMPINRAYPLDDLLGTLKELSSPKIKKPAGSKFSITFEYILIRDLNDKPEHAKELVKRLHGIPCKVNVLLYNENPNVPYKRPEMERVDAFRKILLDKRVLNFVRASRGRDISAACGQLVSEHKRKLGLDVPRSLLKAQQSAKAQVLGQNANL
jgi:23S rRNA (adenine2503-C2)-methyltransferase